MFCLLLMDLTFLLYYYLLYFYVSNIERRHERATLLFAYAKTKTHISAVLHT